MSIDESERRHAKVSAAIDETLYAYSRGEMSDDMAKESILALIPPQPKLGWRGAQLFMCELRVGYVAEDRNGQMVLCAGEKIIGGSMPVDTARAAVEKAVKKALGWPE